MTAVSQPETSYVGRHADLYDIIYAGKPYAAEAEFVHQCLQQYNSGQMTRILELACGTGTHAIAFSGMGYEVVATDYSEDMLRVAQAKAKTAGSSVEFRRQDMRALKLDTQFDAVVCLFDSIGYVVTNEALAQVLQGVRRHLRPAGLFIFEFWHAAAMLRSFDPIRIARWRVPAGEILRISETKLNCAAQTGSVAYSIYELRDDGSYESLKETQVNRFFLLQEMSAWLSSSGFTPVKWFAGFQPDEKIETDTWHIVAVARRLDD